MIPSSVRRCAYYDRHQRRCEGCEGARVAHRSAKREGGCEGRGAEARGCGRRGYDRGGSLRTLGTSVLACTSVCCHQELGVGESHYAWTSFEGWHAAGVIWVLDRGVLRRVPSVVALLSVLAPALSAQWPSYPTPGVPRTPDGRPNLLAPTPRSADGRPDLSGIWSNPGWRDLGALTGVSGTGGAPGTPSGPSQRTRTLLQHRVGCSRWSALAAVGGGTARKADGRQQQGQSRCALSSARQHAAPHASAASKDYPDVERHRDPVRGQRWCPSNLHGWPAGARQRSAALVVRLLDGSLGWRQPGRRDDWFP